MQNVIQISLAVSETNRVKEEQTQLHHYVFILYALCENASSGKRLAVHKAKQLTFELNNAQQFNKS
jgi:hypothetical protein